MILLDAYALLALALDEAVADEVEEIVRKGGAAISAANFLEVTDHLVRRSKWTPQDTGERFGLLIGDRVAVIPLDEHVAWNAALLRARHYDRLSCSISLADCVLLATAGRGHTIVTADPAVAYVAGAEGIDLHPLPDSSGRRP